MQLRWHMFFNDLLVYVVSIDVPSESDAFSSQKKLGLYKRLSSLSLLSGLINEHGRDLIGYPLGFQLNRTGWCFKDVFM